MSLKVSKALRNGMLAGGGFRQLMTQCVLKAYTGSQPATAEAAPTGTLLCTYSLSGGSLTREVRATGTVTISGASGSLDTLKVGGIEVMGAAVSFNTDLTTTAALIAAQINSFHDYKLVTATSAGAVITLTANRGFGAAMNGATVVSTATTLGRVDVNMGSGVSGVTGVNGLNFDVFSAGVISKAAAETWQGTPVATGTAGWFRFEASVVDSLALDNSEIFPRMDGTIATSGAELNLGNTSFTIGVPQVVNSFTITFPTA